MKTKINNARGFTMIELLIVLGILALVSTIVVLIINPTQLIAQSRDAQRISDLKRIDTTIQLNKNSFDETLTDNTAANIVYVSLPDISVPANPNDNCGTDGEYVLPDLVFGWQYRCVASSTNLRKVDGTGWIPIVFTSVSTNSLTTLPVDPVNTAINNNYYAYAKDSSSSNSIVASKLDSQKYLTQSASTDGGNDTNYYETSPAPWINWTPYIAINSGNNISILNSSTGSVINTYGVGSSPGSVVIDSSGNAWVANTLSGTISKIDLKTGTTLGTYSLGVGNLPMQLAIDASGNVWVTNDPTPDPGVTLIKLNGSTGAVMGSYTIGNSQLGGPLGVAVDPLNNIWITDVYPPGNVFKVNSSTGTIIGTYPTNQAVPEALAADASGNIWITNINSDNITKLNGSTGVIIGTYSSGLHPQGVAVDQSGNIWISNVNGINTVTKLNGSTGGVIGTYAVTDPGSIGVDASGNIWVSSNVTGPNVNLVKLNGSTGTVIGTYTVGGHPAYTTLGDFTGFAYQYFVLGRR